VDGTTKRAFLIVWYVLSCVILALLVTPYLVPASRVGGLIPACSSGVRGAPCPLCGMTTAFYRISKGEYGKAQTDNAYAGTLYLLFVVNEVVLGGFIAYEVLRRVRRCKC
jgi:hypothetical protein